MRNYFAKCLLFLTGLLVGLTINVNVALFRQDPQLDTFARQPKKQKKQNKTILSLEDIKSPSWKRRSVFHQNSHQSAALLRSQSKSLQTTTMIPSATSVAHFLPCSHTEQILRPAFVIPGVEKGGSTALFNFLRAHPQIISKIGFKEAGSGSETLFLGELWNRGGPRETNSQRALRYSNMFQALPPGKAGDGCKVGDPMLLAGDKTPSYLALPRGAEKLHSLVSSARIIISLREPVSRAISEYNYFDFYKSDFSQHIDDEISLVLEFKVSPQDKNMSNFNHFNDALLRRFRPVGRRYHRGAIVGFGMYVVMLRHWMSIFPPGHIRVVFLEEWRGKGEVTNTALNNIFKWLGLPPIHSSEFGDTARPINKKRAHKTVTVVEKRQLQNFYAPYNEELERLLGRRLPNEWYYK